MLRPSSGKVIQRSEGRKGWRWQVGARRVKYNTKETVKA